MGLRQSTQNGPAPNVYGGRNVHSGVSDLTVVNNQHNPEFESAAVELARLQAQIEAAMADPAAAGMSPTERQIWMAHVMDMAMNLAVIYAEKADISPEKLVMDCMRSTIPQEPRGSGGGIPRL